MLHDQFSFKSLLKLGLFFCLAFFVTACGDDDDMMMDDDIELTGDSEAYELKEIGTSGVSGSAVFEKTQDGATLITLMLVGTPDDGDHPAHIHMNSAVIGGGIAISLDNVDGSTGESETLVESLDDGTTISYEELLDYDGYINVHLSPSDLATVVAQGDIGENELTGESISYTLEERAVPGISGEVIFEERKSGFALATISLEGTPDGGEHPAHIHMNSAAIGGGILYTFNPVDGTTGISMSGVRSFDDGSVFEYDQLQEIDGYVNVHLSANELATIVAQGDIGQNALTGNMLSYPLEERAVAGISGEVVFEERLNGFILATITLDGTPDGGEHPAHIHANSAAEGGSILVSFSPVDGTSGMSRTDIKASDDGTALLFDDIAALDAYVNVHLSANELSTIVAQGDIGQNSLTGNSTTYMLSERMVPGISGSVTFEERLNGNALATIVLTGTPDGGSHPAHIHANSFAIGGGILFTFNPVDGTSGMSRTNVEFFDDGRNLTYDDIEILDAYVNVHLSANDLATIVAQGDIGTNTLTGRSATYPLDERMVPGISGSVTFEERINGFTLATISLEGTPDGGEHPAHIHENSAEEGGGILYTFNPIDGTSGTSFSGIRTLDDGSTLSYEDLLVIDGYVNVHLSANDLATIVAQGNVGSNF